MKNNIMIAEINENDLNLINGGYYGESFSAPVGKEPDGSAAQPDNPTADPRLRVR